MNKWRTMGCLWVFIEMLCLALFVVLLIMKLFGAPIPWMTVFSALIVGFAVSVVLIIAVMLVGIFEDKNGEE